MKILIIHQPFPMGNFKLNNTLGQALKQQGHEVSLLQQLNVSELAAIELDQLVTQINEYDPDVVYFEMLDLATFELVRSIKCTNRILCISSEGVWGFNNILHNRGMYFDKVLTNSQIIFRKSFLAGIPTMDFQYYFNCISDKEMAYDGKYDHQCVFVGMGFNRLTSPAYQLERNVFFESATPYPIIYGNGWQDFQKAKGILPVEDLGKVYTSAQSGVAIVAPSQRSMGMINNRYSEMMSCGCPIITYPYEEVDWFGADKFFIFVDSPYKFEQVFELQQDWDIILSKQPAAKKFMKGQDKVFFDKLNELMIL